MQTSFQDRRAQVLIVEDTPVHRQAIQTAVQRIDLPQVEVHEAQNVNHALDLLDEHEIDVCLVDYHLWDGDTAPRFLDSARHHGHDAAFVAITGRVDEESLAHELLIADFDDVMHKDDLQNANLYRIIRNSWLRNIRTRIIEERATIDSLTGVHNRRSILARLQVECDRSERLGTSFAVLYLDLNNFKSINDQNGHAAGDKALKHLAVTLLGVIRKTDVVGRLGGDEFVVLLTGSGQAVANSVAEKIRRRISESPVPVGDTQLVLTAAAGVAVYNPESGLVTPQALLDAADQAMYQDKQARKQLDQKLSA